ncbi:MAG: 4Fe-4S binding protein [Bacteroidota bacterium]|nr:4Fe-4S binding protein [Bacteroidota bacterium]
MKASDHIWDASKSGIYSRNLLKIKPVWIMVKSKYYPIIPQLITLSVFVVLFIGSIGVGYDPKIAPYIASTNLANQLVWNIWWPFTLVFAAIAGRLWCSVCPLELVNTLGSRIGLKKKAPAFLRSGWVVTLLFAFILFGAGKYLGLQAVPRTLAIYLATIVSLSFILGLIYEKRSFCSYVCPLGSILGMYSYIAGTEWRADDKTVCNECKTKDCVAKSKHYKLCNHSCTSNLNPARISDNRDCLLCTHCLKACPSTNFRFSLRLPFTDFFKNIELTYAEMGILMLLIGFVNNNWHALVLFTLVPLTLCLLVAWKSWKPMLNIFMVLLIPTTAAAHMLHAFRGVIWNWPLYKLNFQDPLGVRTATLLAEKTLSIDRSGLGPAWELLGITTGLLYGAVFAVSVAIILKSPLTEHITRTGRLMLILSVASYIASFYMKV